MLAYTNPVYGNYFADPFVWKHRGRYYAVGTGPVEGQTPGREEFVFPLLSSDDFVSWKYVRGALQAPSFAVGGAFWAPEVAFHDGKFYLYYSVATDKEGLAQQLRVAVSESPEGPYEDAGLLMKEVESCPFAIDAHPFRDDDGAWYLFYARDFLDTEGGARAGTALVVDRLEGMTRLAGEERAVMRARREWQRFMANRTMYGKVFDWHTLEGPCARKHEGRYYCFYSGGCYQDASYGVDYAVADHVLGPYRDEGAEEGARVLKTVPGHVIGPGHHSIVTGPNGQDFIAYHAWDPAMTARRMCLDPLIWTPQGPRCDGPSWTKRALAPQP